MFPLLPQPQLLRDGPSPHWDRERGRRDRSSVSASEVSAGGWGQVGRDPRPPALILSLVVLVEQCPHSGGELSSCGRCVKGG